MKRVLRNGRYANVTATMALVVALGGTSYAAVLLPADSVGSGQIRPLAVKRSDIGFGSVTTGKVKNGTLRAADFAPNQLPARPPFSNPMYAHVLADGTLDLGRTTPGIGMTRVLHGTPSGFPAYCFDLPQSAENVQATVEKSSVETPGSMFPVSMAGVTINATLDTHVIDTWECPASPSPFRDAAVLSMQRPTGGFYATFQ